MVDPLHSVRRKRRRKKGGCQLLLDDESSAGIVEVAMSSISCRSLEIKVRAPIRLRSEASFASREGKTGKNLPGATRHRLSEDDHHDTMISCVALLDEPNTSPPRVYTRAFGDISRLSCSSSRSSVLRSTIGHATRGDDGQGSQKCRGSRVTEGGETLSELTGSSTLLSYLDKSG